MSTNTQRGATTNARPAPASLVRRIAELRGTPMVYIAGPYAKGDMAHNVSEAVEWMAALMDQCGETPICPHLTHFAHLIHPRRREEWLDYDAAVLVRCDAVLRIPGESVGAELEVELARATGKEVFFAGADDRSAYMALEAISTWAAKWKRGEA